MKVQKQKFDFTTTYNGEVLKFKGINLPVDSEGKPNWASAGSTSQVLRQFIKQVFGYKVRIKTDYNSADIWLDTPIEEEEFKTFQNELVCKFKQGHFDGMTDLYEYHPNHGLSAEIDGAAMRFSYKWMSVHNQPKWGTPAYREWQKNEAA